LRLAIDDNDEATKEACTSVFQSVIRQTWYRFKRSYFNSVLADQIRKTSLVSCMNDAQWCALVHEWLSSKNKVCVSVCVCVCVCELIYFLSNLYVVYLCCSLTQLWYRQLLTVVNIHHKPSTHLA
jgi:hypothetical protein